MQVKIRYAKGAPWPTPGWVLEVYSPDWVNTPTELSQPAWAFAQLDLSDAAYTALNNRTVRYDEAMGSLVDLPVELHPQEVL